MAYLTTGEYAVKPRVSRDDKYVHICLGAHNILGLSRTEAILLAADLMDAVEARSIEHVEVLPPPLEAAIRRNEVKAMNAVSHKIRYGLTEDDEAREQAIAERIEKDADRVRELVADGIGVDDPCTDDAWAADVLIALRELGSVFDRLTHGDTLTDAIKTPGQMQHFRTLLRCAKTADAWIAAQIKEAAELESAP